MERQISVAQGHGTGQRERETNALDVCAVCVLIQWAGAAFFSSNDTFTKVQVQNNLAMNSEYVLKTLVDMCIVQIDVRIDVSVPCPWKHLNNNNYYGCPMSLESAQVQSK